MIDRLQGSAGALHGGVASTGTPRTSDRSFATELRREELRQGRDPRTPRADRDPSETRTRLPLGEKPTEEPPTDPAPQVARVPLGTLRGGSPRGRTPVGSGDAPAAPQAPRPTDVPRGGGSDPDTAGPVQLTSRGGYKNAADYTRDEGWTKHPNALYPDPSQPGYWIDPVTGRSGIFPSGYVPGMPLGDPGNPNAGAPSSPDPADDPLAAEMSRLGMDPADRLERMQFVASVDADMRNWLNQILEKRGMDPVEERPLEELSDDMARDIQERRDKQAQRAEVLADLAEGNGSVRGSPSEGGVPVFEPSGD